ncbi:hypothetical protein DBV15_05463 [Temnothorax longispinosus]|uniref:Uncharacterized protein n=1 Tax=Temnothorax longispinosus TaxID=300112 RepID=A0A4S2KXX1_9HYME|nr:hypothetical protein DBV15_05463 [Temnothorax longispinosus]
MGCKAICWQQLTGCQVSMGGLMSAGVPLPSGNLIRSSGRSSQRGGWDVVNWVMRFEVSEDL